MKDLFCIVLLGLLISCNSTDTTAGRNDVDHTDVDDSTSAKSNLPWRDTLDATKDTMAMDSIK